MIVSKVRIFSVLFSMSTRAVKPSPKFTCLINWKVGLFSFDMSRKDPLSQKGPTAPTMVEGPRTFWGDQKVGDQKKGCKVWNIRDFCGFCFLRLGAQNWFLGLSGDASVAFYYFLSSLAVLAFHIQFYHFFKTCHSVFQCFSSIIPISVVCLWLGTTIISGMIISLAILFH